MNGREGKLRVVTVCSHNRTRSVMMAALLESMLVERLGAHEVAVTSAGFGPEGLASIAEAVEAMERRGLDISAHRSRRITRDDVVGADLVLTAERDHVVRIAAMSPPTFRRAFTLPEFLDRAGDALPHGNDLPTWIEQLAADRTARDYLAGTAPEVPDPTGMARREFESAVVRLEMQCRETVARLLTTH